MMVLIPVLSEAEEMVILNLLKISLPITMTWRLRFKVLASLNPELLTH